MPPSTTELVTIPLDKELAQSRIAVAPDGRQVYVTVRENNPDGPDPGAVCVIDTASHTVTAEIAVGRNPGGVAVTPDGRHVYVACWGAQATGLASVIDTARRAVVAEITLSGPHGIATDVAISPDGSHAYVLTNQEQVDASGRLNVIDTASQTVIDKINILVQDPRTIVVTPDGQRAYVNSESEGVDVVVDLAAKSVGLTVEAFRMAITPDGRRAYAIRFANQDVSVFDLATEQLTHTILTQGLTTDVAIMQDGRHVYVTQRHTTHNVIVINTETNKVTGPPVTWNGLANAIAIAPNGTRAYVVDGHSRTIVVIPIPHF
ncbi:hypothetical protein ACFCZ1_12430 [Streptomyces sp. NPDC056224]|uniref:hypothetical protein n=1 Tax=Streptomyces sp. NPDC056224 TaxID=3345750 RepID=UPI0035D9D675